MTSVPAALRQAVWGRAGSRCEYCQMAAEFDRTSFQIDHIIPEKLDGETVSENLALACFRCNNHKGPNIAGIDPESGDKAFLFNPRRDAWADHFHWQGPLLQGTTAKGRSTIALLQINAEERVFQRRQLIVEGVFPPM